MELPLAPGRANRLRRAWRRSTSPMLLSSARLRARPGRTLLLLVGVAAAIGLLVGVLGGTVVGRDLSLQRAVAALPPAERSFRVDLVGLPAGTDHARLDAAARRALAEVTPGEPLRVVTFRDFFLDREYVRVAGIDDPRPFVHLLSGRFPRRCDPQVCEVVQIGRGGRSELEEGDIHLVRVGVATLEGRERLGPSLGGQVRQLPVHESYPRPVVLLARDADAIERLPSFQLFSRIRSWIVPLEPSDLHEWQVKSLLERESRAHAILEQADLAFTLEGPDAALLDASARGGTYARRAALIGGSAGVALLGFAILAAAGLRRGVGAERRRLAQHGATRPQQFVAVLTEVGVIVALGWLVGLVAGVLTIAVIAGWEGLPAVATLWHALDDASAIAVLGIGVVVVVALVSWAVVVSESEEGRPRVRALDVVAFGAAAAVAIGMSRGALHPDSGGETTFLLVLPALICVVGGLAAARLLGPLMRLAERAARRGPGALRLGLLALARSPARTAAAGAFLAVTIGLVIFATTYRSTLERGTRDEAAFAVPLDGVLTPGSSLAQPLEAAPRERYERLAAGVRAYPVLRTTADVVGSGTAVQAATVLGVPRAALEAMRWRSDFSPTSRGKIVDEVGLDAPLSLVGARLPEGARGLRLPVRLRGAPLSLAIVVRDAGGRIRRLPLGTVRQGARTLSARISPGALEVLGLELSLSKAGRAWFLHLAREGKVVSAPSGVLSLGRLTAPSTRRSSTVTMWTGWVTRGRDATVATRRKDGVTISYTFPEVGTLLLRPREPTDGHPLKVIASPAVAKASGPGGLLTLDYYDARVDARIVATARRFPTIGEDEEFVVADESAVSTALDGEVPGIGAPGELWLSFPDKETRTIERALGRAPFTGFDLLVREGLQREARDEPLARTVVFTLGAAALIALVLAVVGLWASVVSDLRDERDTLFDLEAQGATPETLRRHMRIRAGALLVFGVAGGCVLGLALSRLVASLVQVTAQATRPMPPLVLDADLVSILIALGILVVAAAVAVELTIRQAFRGEIPERASWSFE